MSKTCSPLGWAFETVGTLATFEYGAALQAERRSGDGYPVFGSNGQVGKHSSSLMQGPGIVVGRKGTVGAVVWSETPFWPIDTTYYVLPRPGIDLRWLYWVLLSLELGRFDSSTGVPGLNRKDAYDQMVCRPPLPEQRRIAEILDTLDDQIQFTEAALTKALTVEEALFESLARTANTAPIRLGTLLSASPKNGYSPVSAGEVTGSYLVGLGCLTKHGFEARQLKNAPANDPLLQPALLHDGDLLLSRSNTRELVGMAGVFRDVGVRCYYPDLMMRLPTKPQVNVAFLEMALRSNAVRTQIQNLAGGTSGSMVKVSGAGVSGLTVELPEPPEQESIMRVVLAARSQRLDIASSLSKFRALRTGLMADLLSGHVRVPGGESDG
ncbi:MAG: restriction endonuclease subunit S [Propionibacteriaceae bacterium]|jgi:type I restriction enzyme S subunit|nr:restriction endonuclease subunit S [Propionibacteriaceae bacterium]